MTIDISARRRREVINALRGGTVPQSGLDVLAVGLGRFESAIDAELADVAAGGAVFGVIPQNLLDKEVGHPGLTELRVVATMHERKIPKSSASLATRSSQLISVYLPSSPA